MVIKRFLASHVVAKNNASGSCTKRNDVASRARVHTVSEVYLLNDRHHTSSQPFYGCLIASRRPVNDVSVS